MYTLLSGLYKYVFQKDEYCVLILGLDNAGKTVRFYIQLEINVTAGLAILIHVCGAAV